MNNLMPLLILEERRKRAVDCELCICKRQKWNFSAERICMAAFNRNSSFFCFSIHKDKLSMWHEFYLIKVCYDLVEKTEALQSFLIDIRLGVKLFEIWDGGEHHTHRVVWLMIKVLITSEREKTARCVVLIDWGERKRQKVCDFDRPRPDSDTDSKNTYNESLIISVRGHYGRDHHWIDHSKDGAWSRCRIKRNAGTECGQKDAALERIKETCMSGKYVRK